MPRNWRAPLQHTLSRLRAGEFDYHGQPFPWFATDSADHVALMFANIPLVPETVCSLADDDYFAAIDYSGVFTESPRSGFFEYFTYVSDAEYYEREVVPDSPIVLNAVPPSVRSVYSIYRFSNVLFANDARLYFDDENWSSFLESVK